MRISSSCREHRCEVSLNAFPKSSRRIFGSFWAQVELKSHLGRSLRALFVSEADLTGSTHPILEDLGKLFGRFLEIFL